MLCSGGREGFLFVGWGWLGGGGRLVCEVGMFGVKNWRGGGCLGG